MENNGLMNEFKDLDNKSFEFDKKCSKLTQDILNGKSTILKLVEDLGPLLVDISPDKRELGIQILNQVLNGLPTDHLSNETLTFICTFYADRLNDHHQVVPNVLQGIIVLTKFNHFPNGAATQILKALFQNVPCQQQQQSDRHNIYIIFEKLFNQHQTELCEMGLDFIYGVISAVDSERDPKNLIFLFKWFPQFLQNVKLGHLTEEMFEVLACYFPIDFRTPSQHSNNITREDLSEALSPCLCAIPDFADYCLPLALEKLDSSLQIAKLDSLKLLRDGCRTFGVSSYLQHSSDIWSQIQQIFFISTDDEIKSVCLETLSNVIKKFSESNETISNILTDITDSVKGNLLPDSKLFESTTKFLIAIASSSEYSSKFMANEVVPILTNTYTITTDPRLVCKIMSTLVGFVQAYYLFNKNEIETINVVPVLFLQALLNNDSYVIATGFDSLSSVANYLPLTIRNSVYNNIQKNLITSTKQPIKDSILNCFQTFAMKYSEEVQTNIINKIIVPDVDSLNRFLKALSLIANHDYFTDFVTNYMLEESLLEQEAARTALVIQYMRKILENDNEGKLQTDFYNKNLIDKLINWTINQKDNISNDLLIDLGFVFKSIVCSQTVQIQKLILKNYLPHIVSQLRKKHNFKLIFLLDGLLCRIRKDVEVDYQILDDLLVILKEEQNIAVRRGASMLIANLLNKCSNEEIIERYLNNVEAQDSQNDFVAISWITKALVMRNHGKSEYWIDKLFNLLEKNVEAVSGFRIIMNDNLDSLSTKSDCIKTLLYRQKFFILASNKLAEKYQPENTTYLKAFGYLLEYAPKTAILLQLNKLLKLFILCLEHCKDGEVLCILLQILKTFIIDKEKSIEEHLEEFLSRLLELSLNNYYMKVRIHALQCIQLYPSYFPLYKLLPLKNDVIIKLGKCTDDKKRFARKEAVRAISSWYLLDFQSD